MKNLLIAGILGGLLIISGTVKADEVDRVWLGAGLSYHQQCNSLDSDGEAMYMWMLESEMDESGLSQEGVKNSHAFQMGYIVANDSIRYKGDVASCQLVYKFLWDANSHATQLIF